MRSSTPDPRVIGLDFDDVLFDCNGSLCRFIGERYAHRYTFAEHHTWHLHVLWGCSEEEGLRRLSEWSHSDYHRTALPIAGAVSAVAELVRRGYELHIITSRTPELREFTLEWINDHFPRDSFKGVHFVGRGTPGTGDKSAVCHRIGTLRMIDDSPIHVPEMVNRGVDVILFDAPWNQGVVFPYPVPRAYTWEDVLRLVG